MYFKHQKIHRLIGELIKFNGENGNAGLIPSDKWVDGQNYVWIGPEQRKVRVCRSEWQ